MNTVLQYVLYIHIYSSQVTTAHVVRHPVCILVSHVPVNILYKLICCCLSGWASGTGHRRPQGADGEAGEGGTGALGVWRYGLAGQPPTAGHSCRPPAPSVLIHVRRRPRHKHKRGQPCVRTWPGEEYSTLARKTLYLRFPGSGTSKWRGGTIFAEKNEMSYWSF